MKTTTIILAGGRNRRLGRNKALMQIGGRTMIERVIDRLTPVTERFIVVTAQDTPELPISGKAETATDLYPRYGPMGGIYSGLVLSEARHNIIIACDMPFINARLLERMLEVAPGFDAVVPRLENGFVEPLHAIYATGCRDRMKELLDNDTRNITPLFEHSRVRYFEEEESRALDPEHLSFFNINFPEDFEKAEELVSREDTL